MESKKINPFIDYVNYHWSALSEGKHNKSEDSSITTRISGFLGIIPSIIILPIGTVSLLVYRSISWLSNRITNELNSTQEIDPKDETPIKTNKIFDLIIPKARYKKDTKKYEILNQTYTKQTLITTGESKTVYNLTTDNSENSLIRIKANKKENKIDQEASVLKLRDEMLKLYKFKGSKEFAQIIASSGNAIILENAGSLNLRDLNKNLNRPTQVNLFKTLAKAAAKLQNNQLTHHNLKPSSIFAKEDNGSYTFTVGDFSAAQYFSEENINAPATALSPYSAPECFKKGVDRSKSDLWSIGVIMYVNYFRKWPDYMPMNIDQIQEQGVNEKFIEILGIEKIDEDSLLQTDINSEKDSIPKIIKDLLKVNPEERISANVLIERLEKLPTYSY